MNKSFRIINEWDGRVSMEKKYKSTNILTTWDAFKDSFKKNFYPFPRPPPQATHVHKVKIVNNQPLLTTRNVL